MALSYTAPRIEVEAVEREINNLDEKEKEQLFKDIYGDDETIEETPELIADSLSKLHQELNSIEDKEAYDRAQEECSDYANSQEFLLPFLRTESFDAKKAAPRIVSYWEHKLRTFGEDRTFGPLTIDQLEEGDLQVLKETLHFLPHDNFGRVVLYVDRGSFKLRKENGRRSILRAYFYLVHVSAWGGVVEKQKGVVLISATDLPFSMDQFDRILMKDGYKMGNCHPNRMVANHFVHRNSMVKLVMPSFLWLMGSDARKRFKIHHYTCDKNIHEYFAKFGLEPSGLPRSCGGSLQYDGEAWIRERREAESGNTEPN